MEPAYNQKQFDQHFRAVSLEGRRHGLRLERVYWDTIDLIAKTRGVSSSEYVRSIIANDTIESSSMSSKVRAATVADVIALSPGIGSTPRKHPWRRIVNASTAPTFVMTSENRIVDHNRAFVRYVESNIPVNLNVHPFKDAKLAIEIATATIFDRLKAEETLVIQAGFALGVVERMVRGRLNLTAAEETASPTAVIAFVVQ